MSYYLLGDRRTMPRMPRVPRMPRGYPGGKGQFEEDFRDGGWSGLMPPFNRKPARRARRRESFQQRVLRGARMFVRARRHP